MFYCKISCFYQDFKRENLCFLNPCYTGPVTKGHVKSSQMRSKEPL